MPMDEITLKIGGLLEVAEAQQQAVAAQLEQLQQQTAALAQAAANVNDAAQHAVLALQEAAEAAISDAVRETPRPRRQNGASGLRRRFSSR